MKIQILMSTYNGSDYIRTQLDSIAAQDVEEKTLLIRDDGSADSTVEIIRKYQEENPWVFYYKGENIGVQRSFFDLMSRVDENADYIAFADQDDEWLPDKLSRAVYCLENRKHMLSVSSDTPLLYCSDKQIVGRNLEPINVTVSRVVRKVSFGNALIQNICTGCTAVANRALINLVRNHMPKEPARIIMHDWWLYLTASCFGEVFYDHEAHIRYRQHGGNTSGAMLNHRKLLAYRFKQLMKPRGEIYKQNLEFQSCFFSKSTVCTGLDHQYVKQYELLKIVLRVKLGLWNRFLLASNNNIFRQKRMDNCIYKIITLIGKL